jgi:hypothetical protein
MKRINIFPKIIKAIKDPLFIVASTKEKTISVILYMILLVLILTIPTSIVRGVMFSNEMDNLIEAVDNPSFPDFQLKDGKFSIDSDEPIIIEQGKDLKIIIDTEDNHNINNLAGFASGYLLTEDVAIVTMKGQSPAYYNLDTFSSVAYDKTIFVDQLHFIAKIGVFLVPFLFIAYAILNAFFRSLMLLLLGFFLKRMMQLTLKGSELYKMVIYSMTLGFILYELMSIIPLFISMPVSASFLTSLAPVVFFYIPSSTILSRSLRIFKVQQDIENIKKKDLDA